MHYNRHQLLHKSHREIDQVNANYRNPLSFLSMAFSILDIFAENNTLAELQIVSVAKVKDLLVVGNVAVEHFVKVTFTGTQSKIPTEWMEQTLWIEENWPCAEFGNGAIKIARSDAVVQQYLQCTDPHEQQVIAYTLLLQLRKELAGLMITHSVNPFKA